MNIKSLLLGSAAALVAVSGARAADAVVIAEPEPMEYVRICDTYGVGFYYIPGTETCLKVSGYIRYDIGMGAFGLTDVLDKKDFANGEFNTNDTYDKRARFQLRVDSRTETELGTLRTYAAVNFQWDTGSTGQLRPSTTTFGFNNGFTIRVQLGRRTCLSRTRRLPHRQDQLAVLDLHRLCRRRDPRRHHRLRPVRYAPDRLYLHRRQRLQRRDRS